MSTDQSSVLLVPACTYKLDPKKIAAFKQQLSSELQRRLVQKIIDHTVHVNFPHFLQLLTSSLEKFKQYIGNKPFTLIVTDKDKSDMWVWKLAQKIFPDLQKNLKQIIFIESQKRLTEVDMKDLSEEVVFMDDGIFSGVHLDTLLEEFLQIIDQVSSIYKVNKSGRCKKYHFSVVTAVSSSLARVNVEQSLVCFGSYHHFWSLGLDPVSSYLNKRECLELEKMYPREDGVTTYGEQHSVYFDHKLPGDHSSLPLIYQGTLPLNKEEKSTYKLEDTFESMYINPLFEQNIADIPIPYRPEECGGNRDHNPFCEWSDSLKCVDL